MGRISVGGLLGMVAGLLLLALAAVFGFALWALYHPDKAWRIIQPMVVPRDVQVSWASAQFVTKKSSLQNWRLDWALNGLKITREKPRLQLQLDVKLAAQLTLFNPTTGVRIENLEVISNAPAVVESPPDGPAPENPHERAERLRRQLERLDRYVALDKLKISVPELTAGGGNKVGISALKPGAKDPKAVEFNVTLKTDGMEGSALIAARMDQVVNGGAFLTCAFQAQGASWTLAGEVDLSLPEQQLVLGVKLKGAHRGAPFRSDAQVTVQSNRVVVEGRSDFDRVPGLGSAVRGAQWSMELPLWPGVVLSSLAGQMKISAPVSLSFISPEVRDLLEKNCQCKWPTTLKATLDGKVWAAHIFDNIRELRPIATLSFKFDPISNSLLVLDLAAELRITRNKDQSFTTTPVVNAQIKLPNFQMVKSLLEANKIMVPSPFDILQGAIEATVKTTLFQNDKGLVIPIEARANLASSDQKVNLESKINLAIPPDFKSVDIMADINVNDFIVELPPMDPVQGLPRLTKDPRVQMSPETPVPANAFKFRLMYGISTTKPGAIRLLTKLAKPAIPVSLDLDRTARGDTLGTVKVEPFELTYLHRVINIDQLRVILDDRETADFAVDGHLRIEQSQAKVKIAISGSLRSPLIKLSSEPEMSRSDIISVLLYDRTSDQLVSADRETVGSFEAAISDRAIGLLGLWVFASTPIRSFSYNPLTKVYTATVQLGPGTTASVGTDWEEAAQLEVRKRVTRRWVLTASWAPSDTKEQLGKLVLQWEKRF